MSDITLDLLTKNRTTIDTDFILDYSKKIRKQTIFKDITEPLNHGSESVPLELENEKKLKNIKGNWCFPFNENRHKNEFLTGFVLFSFDDEKAEKLTNQLYDEYINLNPSLNKLYPVDFISKQIIMDGITSLYNFEDIKEFLEYSEKGYMVAKTRMEEKDYYRLNKKAEKLLGRGIGYVPSKKTLKTIINQLE